MSDTVSIRELSHETSRTLRRVKGGETVEITERGKVIARITPAGRADDVRGRLIAQGRMVPASGGRVALLATVGRRVAAEAADGASRGAAEVVEMRDGERY